jgi:hypothetical protein
VEKRHPPVTRLEAAPDLAGDLWGLRPWVEHHNSHRHLHRRMDVASDPVGAGLLESVSQDRRVPRLPGLTVGVVTDLV